MPVVRGSEGVCVVNPTMFGNFKEKRAMMRYTMSQLLRLSEVAGSVALGGVVAANAANLTLDGDFNAQTNGIAVSSPWYGDGTVGSTGNSPFTNAFAANGKTAYANAGTPYIIQDFSSITLSSATGFLYLNLDFKFTGTGGFNWIVSDGNYSTGRSLALYFNSGDQGAYPGVYAESDYKGGLGSSIMTPELDTWYNVQLTLNMDDQTYSGVITREGTLAQTLISSRGFIGDTGAIVISKIYSDSNRSAMGLSSAGMNHYVDNVVLSTTPMPIPEPGALALAVCGAVGLLASRKQRANKR
jgi:hypothetical protein